MRIERLRLRSFRNYEQADVRPAPGVTVLYGENAQGKTNLMEAVHLCCVGRSHRTSRDRELVRWGESEAYVQADVRRLDGPRQIGVALFPSETKKKKITINSEPVKRIGELMGQVNAVLFSPEDLRLVKDGPDGRRRFLDMEISQLQPAYFYALQRYARALNQRNGLLRELQGRSDGALASTIEEWDALLAQTGAAVLARRKAYLARLDEKAREIHRDLSGGRETLTLRYAGCDGDEQGLLMLLRWGPANRHNVNDNTSGVAALLHIMEALPPEHRSKAAFVLFDNEEKGKAGSAAYAKEHQQVAYTRLTVNLDCVGVGEHILIISKKLARQHLEFAPMQRHMAAQTARQVHFFDAAGSMVNSDQANFKCAVAVCACKRKKGVGFYTPAIHTARDTQADQGNLDAIASGMSGFVQELNT